MMYVHLYSSHNNKADNIVFTQNVKKHEVKNAFCVNLFGEFYEISLG